MSEITQARLRAAVVALAPVFLLVGFLILPYPNRRDNAAVVQDVAANPDRFAIGVLVAAAAMALSILSVYSLRFYLRAAGEDTWSFVAVPLVVIGGTAIVVGMSLTMGLASVLAAGGNGKAYLDAADAWSLPLFIGGGAILSLGWLSVAGAVMRSQILSRELTWVVVGGTIVSTVANFIPTAWAPYVIAIAAIAAAWPLAREMWGHTAPQPRMHARPMGA